MLDAWIGSIRSVRWAGRGGIASLVMAALSMLVAAPSTSVRMRNGRPCQRQGEEHRIKTDSPMPLFYKISLEAPLCAGRADAPTLLQRRPDQSDCRERLR